MTTAFNDDALIVEKALSDKEKALVRNNFMARNPRFTSNDVADILTALFEREAHIDIIAPLLRQHPELADHGRVGPLAILAVVYSAGAQEDRACGRCHAAGELPARPPFAAETPCRQCGGKKHVLQPAAPWYLVSDLMHRVAV